MTSRTVLCRQCGNGFAVSGPGAFRFCGDDCRKASKRPETVRTRNCEHCGGEFSYDIARGTDRRLCSDDCRHAKRHVAQKSQPLCVVPGCNNHRGYSNGVCNSCYYRLRRTGTLNRRTFKRRTLTSHGYISLTGCQGHPLARSAGLLYEHRRVLYDAIGPGPHQCFWCKAAVEWARQAKAGCPRGNLVPDHLNGDKADNSLENLVPACNPCNARRGLFMKWVKDHADDPVLWRMYQEALRRAV